MNKAKLVAEITPQLLFLLNLTQYKVWEPLKTEGYSLNGNDE